MIHAAVIPRPGALTSRSSGSGRVINPSKAESILSVIGTRIELPNRVEDQLVMDKTESINQSARGKLKTD
jgi:hypothetical protein